MGFIISTDMHLPLHGADIVFYRNSRSSIRQDSLRSYCNFFSLLMNLQMHHFQSPLRHHFRQYPQTQTLGRQVSLDHSADEFCCQIRYILKLISVLIKSQCKIIQTFCHFSHYCDYSHAYTLLKPFGVRVLSLVSQL